MQLLGCKHIRTTSYHPAANGLIECFHRQLKTSLKTHPNPTHWTESLPIVLLGLRTQLKEDWYTAPPCVFLVSFSVIVRQTQLLIQLVTYVIRLKSVMKHLQAKPIRKQRSTNVYVSPTLKSCTHVFIHHDTVRKPLQKPYDGPFMILKRSEKHFTTDINGHKEVISVDRLKPAFYDITLMISQHLQIPFPTLPHSKTHHLQPSQP